MLIFRPKQLKNHTIWGRTNFNSLYKGVTHTSPLPPSLGFSAIGEILLEFLLTFESNYACPFDFYLLSSVIAH